MGSAIIIPYRDRPHHLAAFKEAVKDIPIIVIEQDDKPFNRGKLLNVAVLEFDFDNYIFHDVDMIPVNADYSYSDLPCHLATQVQQFDYKMPYRDYFGGVTIVPKDKFEQVNGFSNNYFGWGGEDDELLRRFRERGIQTTSRECRFDSLDHERVIDPLLRMKNIDRLHSPIDWMDGLSSCEYKIELKGNNHIKVRL